MVCSANPCCSYCTAPAFLRYNMAGSVLPCGRMIGNSFSPTIDVIVELANRLVLIVSKKVTLCDYDRANIWGKGLVLAKQL